MSKTSKYKEDLEYLVSMGCKIEKVTRVSTFNDIPMASGMNERQTIAYAASRHRGMMKIVEATYLESRLSGITSGNDVNHKSP